MDTCKFATKQPTFLPRCLPLQSFLVLCVHLLWSGLMPSNLEKFTEDFGRYFRCAVQVFLCGKFEIKEQYQVYNTRFNSGIFEAKPVKSMTLKVTLSLIFWLRVAAFIASIARFKKKLKRKTKFKANTSYWALVHLLVHFLFSLSGLQFNEAADSAAL